MNTPPVGPKSPSVPAPTSQPASASNANDGKLEKAVESDPNRPSGGGVEVADGAYAGKDSFEVTDDLLS